MATENPLNEQDVSPRVDNWPLEPPENSQPLQDNDFVSLNVARTWLPRSNGRRISLDTLYRWCQKGLKNGVRLQAVKVGSRWFTCRRWVQEFVRAGNPNLNAATADTNLRTSPQRHRAANWAEKKLRESWKRQPRNPKW
jgi:hypothetical protein